jgi:cell division cycle 2-like protein
MSDLIKKSRWAAEEEEEKKLRKEKEKKQPKKVSKPKTENALPLTERVVRQAIMRTEKPAPKAYPYLRACRHVDSFERLNHIEEGSYGIVFRARDKETNEVVALKKLKLQPENGGFPVTSLREIHALMIIKHPNIVNVREIVMGNHMDQ